MIKGYYFITDAGLSKNGNASDVKAAIDAGASVVQYRTKDDDAAHMIQEARGLKRLCDKKALFIINDKVDVAVSVDADGVHLGQGDMPYEAARKLLGRDRIIGLTVRNVEEAIEAENKGADYLGVSPVFKTTTKEDAGQPCGVGLVSEIRKACKIPIVAIGGINLGNAREVIEAGANAISAISAVLTKDDIRAEIRKFQNLFR